MSFRRRSAPDSALPAGVALTAAGARVTSSGARGLDGLLGGGVPLGRLTVVLEDAPTRFHAGVVAAFCGQGVAHGHAVALACATVPARDVLSALPSPAASVTVNAKPAPELEIAWRYAAGLTTPAPTAGASTFCVALDASQPTAPGKGARLSALGFPDTSADTLLAGVRAHCETAQRAGVVARVAVAGLDPLLWEWGTEVRDFDAVLAGLRAIATATGAAVLVSVPASVPADVAALSADAVVRLSSFEQDRGRWAGAAMLEKAARVAPGRWLGVRGATYVFRRARRGLVFEEAAIEPEESAEAADLEKSPGKACGAGARPEKNDFDF